MTPYEILQYYYGGDINLVMNAPVGGNVASYPGRPLRRGDAGNDVQTLKRQLNRIGKNYPAIPALDDSFVFDEDMEEAVRVFQQIFNLAQDGIVGKATWYKIKQIYNGVKQLSDLSSEGLTIPRCSGGTPRICGWETAASTCGRCGSIWRFWGTFCRNCP